MDTEQALILWRGAQHDSERMCAQLLLLAEYREVDPSHPLGGPDGTKDAVCLRDNKRWVMAVYFTRDPVDFKDIEDKFRDDAKGIAKNRAQGIVFFTNNKVTVSERLVLSSIVEGAGHEADIYHRERVRLLLDDPRGYGIRFGFLRIVMSEAEQASFFAVYNQTVLARIEEVQRSMREHSALQREQGKQIEKMTAMLEKLAGGQINLGAVLPESARSQDAPAAPEPAPEIEADEDEELTETYPAPTPVASKDEGGAA